MNTINWGIIGAGDVAEVKSGPAFQKTENSELLAVMRRDGKKAADFAERHQVPHWYDDARELLENAEINSVYIATPPQSHLDYALMALQAGKNVYLEKPMALSAKEAKQIAAAVRKSPGKLTVAHYRRRLPAFMKVKELVGNGAVGDIRFADLKILQSKKSDIIAETDENWRLNPRISGGGYFHDLAPHQLDMMYYLFGDFEAFSGLSNSQNDDYEADDLVSGVIAFKNGVQFNGLWCFSVAENDKKDACIIYGSEGTIEFSFYGEKVTVYHEDTTEQFEFQNPKHVQQPMIEATVAYFLGNAENPCTAEEGVKVMGLMDGFTGK